MSFHCVASVSTLFWSLLLVFGAGPATFGQSLASDDFSQPSVGFFYYDAANVEWVVSAEPERLQRHLESNPRSRELLEAVSIALSGSPDLDGTAAQMARWIEGERTAFAESPGSAMRIQMAEGIIAYLRAHDFSVAELIAALQRRSGARDVELVAIQLVDAAGQSSFKLKVILVDPAIEIEQQGFDTQLRSANVSYTAIAYALGVALYEVHEIIHGKPPTSEGSAADEVDTLPEPLSGPALGRNPS